MDRREALKKLAAGAAVGIAAPTIIGSTVFADSGTVSCLPTGLSAATFAGVASINRRQDSAAAEYVELRIPNSAENTVSCPTGYTKEFQYRWTTTASPVDVDIIGNSGLVSVEDLWRQNQVVRIVNIGSTNTLSTSGSYSFNVVVRASCVSPTRVCWMCVGLSFAFSWAYDATATPSVASGGSIVSGGTGGCNQNPLPPA